MLLWYEGLIHQLFCYNVGQCFQIGHSILSVWLQPLCQGYYEYHHGLYWLRVTIRYKTSGQYCSKLLALLNDVSSLFCDVELWVFEVVMMDELMEDWHCYLALRTLPPWVMVQSEMTRTGSCMCLSVFNTGWSIGGIIVLFYLINTDGSSDSMEKHH